MTLLSEAYTLQLLKESAPSMTITEVKQRLPYMSEAEAIYIETVCNRISTYIIEEGKIGDFLSGAGNLGRGIGGSIKRGAQAAGGAIQRGAQAAGGAIADKARTAGNVAQGVGRAAVEGAKTIGGNANQMYQTGKLSNQQAQAVQKAELAVTELLKLLETIKNVPDMREYRGNPDNIKLSRLTEILQAAAGKASQQAETSRSAGLTNGLRQRVGTAFKGV